MSKETDQMALITVCKQIAGANFRQPFTVTYPINATPAMKDLVIATLRGYGFEVTEEDDEFMDYSKVFVYWT